MSCPDLIGNALKVFQLCARLAVGFGIYFFYQVKDSSIPNLLMPFVKYRACLLSNVCSSLDCENYIIFSLYTINVINYN